MTLFTVESLGLGDESALVLQSYATWPDEQPVPGLNQVAFVQLGQALLMVSDGGEGMRFEESEQD
ncbi:MAG TPA: hypothetical protein VFR23_05920 [Jiangellaceae bacterium]|nr:hypothetical protein [Jiangellaceae bacterium]